MEIQEQITFHVDLFTVQEVNKSTFRQSYQYNGPKYFNQLPHDIKRCTSLKSFSVQIKKWLLGIPNLDFLNNVLN